MKAARIALGVGAAALLAAGLRDRRQIPFSSIAARWRVGPGYFDDRGLVLEPGPEVRGLTDSMDVFRRPGLATEHIDPAVRAFYEDTQAHVLSVWPRWTPPFRALYRMYQWMARSVGQTDFPLIRHVNGDRVISCLVPLRGSRPNLRAWIRTYSDDPDRAMYVAEYATHEADGVTYMDIAFPLPGGNLASILAPEPLVADGTTTGFVLTTTNGPRDGHAGIWFVTRLIPIRLPLRETIWVWARGMAGIPADLAARADADTTVLTRHELRMFGIRYLVLDYAISRAPAGPA